MQLSIITINKNNADGLRKTIESVVPQTFKDFEYIVIDGASTDGSVDVIKQYQDYITYWVSESDTGIYNAMNKGLQLAKGQYVQFLNSGDCLFRCDTLESVIRCGLDTDIVYGYQYDDFAGNFVEEQCLDVHYMSFGTLKGSHIPHQSTFTSMSLFKKIGGFSEEYSIISDWAFLMLSLFKWNATIKRIPVHVAIYDTNGISSNPNKHQQNAERRHFIEKEFKWFVQDYDSWDRLKKTFYMRFIIACRNFKNKLIRK